MRRTPIGQLFSLLFSDWTNHLPNTVVTQCATVCELVRLGAKCQSGDGVRWNTEVKRTQQIVQEPGSEPNHDTRQGGLLRVRSGAPGGRPAGAADRLRGEQMQHDLHVRVPGVPGEYHEPLTRT